MKNLYKFAIKPIFDRFFALILIVLLLPIMVFLAVFVAVFIDKKIFFFQERPGKDEKIFKIFKFKTMNDKKNSQGELLPDFKRLNFFGKLLRSSSLDELPELFNVLLGQMSFIGPRPLLVEYLKYYNKEERFRHSVLPGITGLAQVNGRNAISWKEKFALDVYYARNISFWLDLKIVLKTIAVVFARKNVNANDKTTMEKFSR